MGVYQHTIPTLDIAAAFSLPAATRAAVPVACAAVPIATPVVTSSFTLTASSAHCPDAPYRPVSSTAATASSEEAPVALALGIAKADDTDRYQDQTSTIESRIIRPIINRKKKKKEINSSVIQHC